MANAIWLFCLRVEKGLQGRLNFSSLSKELTSDSREAEDMARRAFLDENVRKRWMQCVEIRAGSR